MDEKVVKEEVKADVNYEVEERAAIYEYDGKLTREEAEKRAGLKR